MSFGSHLNAAVVDADVMNNMNSIRQQALLDYVSFRNNNCKSFRVDVDYGQAIEECSGILRAKNGQQVLASASTGNAADCLDVGIRFWTGCGLRKNQGRAMEWWLRIASDTQPTGQAVPRSLRARALACLSAAQWELRISPEDRDTWNVDSVYRAGIFANECTSAGFVSPTILFVGSQIQELSASRKLPPTDHPRFQELEFLWEVIEMRNAEMKEKFEKRDKKVSKAPMAYACAAPGCGLEATKKSGLWQCSGKCPPDVKPAYCSKECQKADWKRHKLICKPKSAETSTPSYHSPLANQEASASSGSIATPTHVSDSRSLTLDESLRIDGREVRMNVPRPGGGTTTMSSKTMSSAFMRVFREHCERMAAEEGR